MQWTLLQDLFVKQHIPYHPKYLSFDLWIFLLMITYGGRADLINFSNNAYFTRFSFGLFSFLDYMTLNNRSHSYSMSMTLAPITTCLLIGKLIIKATSSSITITSQHEKLNCMHFRLPSF